MRRLHYIFFFVLHIHMYTAAPSLEDVSRLEDIAKVETAAIKLDQPITLEEATKSDAKDAQGQRQKRFYHYGFPPMNPVIYPNFPNRVDPYPGGFGEDPFQQIHRRLQDIASVVRAPNFNQAPPPLPFPILFPVIYIPQIGCGCTPNQDNRPTRPSQNNGTDDGVDLSNRFPEMEDERQNWGLVVNQNETVEDDGMPEDFTRPISFEPIRPNRTMSRPPPTVDHGSSQEGRDMMSTTTAATPPPMPPTAAPAFAPANSVTPPSACDTAILTCCHQPEVTYDCFIAQGCTGAASYGNPCDTQVILRVIDRFQRFYGQRTG